METETQKFWQLPSLWNKIYVSLKVPWKVLLNLRTSFVYNEPIQKYDFVFNYSFKFSPSKKPNFSSYSLSLPQSFYLPWDIIDYQFQLNITTKPLTIHPPKNVYISED